MIGRIECRDITKQYGKTTALKGITCTLEPNKIYGLLGRNGAGKTTLLHIINAQLFPIDGSVTIDGEAPFENSNVLQKLCFIRESNNFNKAFRISEVMQFAEAFYPNWDMEYALQLIEEFNLDPRKKVKALSKGMVSALGVTVGLASRAPITIFDEPYIGMDAVARLHFYDLLVQDYTEHPRTIILSTHLIDEVSRIFEQVLIIDQGEVIMAEDTDTLRQRSFYLTGDKQEIEACIPPHTILREEGFGSQFSVAVYGELTEAELRAAKQKGIKIDALPLQQLMVYLSSKNAKRGR